MFGARHRFMALQQNPFTKRQALRSRRQCRPGFMRFHLIPKCHTRHQIIPFNVPVGLAVWMFLRSFMFDLHPKRFFKSNRIRNMKAISRAAVPSLVTFPKRRPIKWARLFLKAPTIAKIILRPRPAQAGFLFAIDEEKIIALPVPAGRTRLDTLDGADVMTATDNIGYQVVPSHDTKIFLAIHGMKITDVFGQRFMLLPVNVKKKVVATLIILVRHGNTSGLL